MGAFKNWVTGKTRRKTEKTKRKVRNVQALSKFKRGGGAGMNVAERHGAKKAATRLGDSMAMFTTRTKRS